MTIFKEVFAWWTGNTIGTRLFTWRQGKRVGTDELGNTYYEQARGTGPLGCPRRWVIYQDLADPSKVPAAWHGWLHYTHDVPPTETDYQRRPWERAHRPNMTGTPDAYRPSGSTLAAGTRPEVTGDYEAWRPE